MLTTRGFLSVLCFAVLEVTPPALLAAAAGYDIWLALLLVALAGVLVELLTAAWLPVERQRYGVLAGGAVSALWAVKIQVGAGYSLFSGWGAAFSVLTLAQPGFGSAYVALLLALYVYWRGTLILNRDSSETSRLFSRTAATLTVIICFIALLDGVQPGMQAAVAGQILLFFAAGLLGLALGGAHERQQRFDRRGILTLIGAVSIVVLGGMALAAFFGGGAAELLGTVWRWVTAFMLLLLLPFVLLVAWLVERLLAALGPLRLSLNIPAPISGDDALNTLYGQDILNMVPRWVLTMLWLALAALPVVLLALLVLYVRSRRPAAINEERESIWSWETASADLRKLFERRPRPAGGLRDALAALQGDAPAMRVRRSYIRMLLAGEAREQPRGPAQTPDEYAPVVAAMLPADAVAHLTTAYDQARYNPGQVTDTEAESAERSWREIDAANRRR